MEKVLRIATNANEVLGQFDRVQNAAKSMSCVIESANKLSSGSFDKLGGVMSKVNSILDKVGGTTQKLSGITSGCRESLNQTVDTLKEYAQNLLYSKLESVGLGSFTEKLRDIDLLSRDGFSETIGILGEYANELKDNAFKTLELLDVRNSMTDAEGNFCLQAAKSTIITLYSSIMKVKDALASVKNAAAKKKEAIATKAGAKVDAVGAKAKMALTAAKPFIGPILLAAAGVALGAGIALLVRKMRTPIPGMATGGVVSAPTMALVGEGRYPEAVVPLGSSPQFAGMKEDIANAVLQGMMASQMTSGRRSRNNSSNEIVLNIDGTKLARVILPQLSNEQKRSGYNLNIREA